MVLFDCSLEEISQTLGPYLGDRVRRRGGSPDGGLKLLVKHNCDSFHLCVEGTHTINDFAEVYWIARVRVYTILGVEYEERVGLCFDLIAHIPQEQIINLETTLPILRSEELCVGMRNLTCLRLIHPDHLDILCPTLGRGDWTPLTSFLTRRAAVGNRISLLTLDDYPRMCPEVVESIERAAEVFER